MAVEKQLPGVFPLLGIDLTKQLYELPIISAASCMNVVKYASGAYGTRKGFNVAAVGESYGLGVYDNNMGSSSPELLRFGNNDGALCKLVDDSLSVIQSFSNGLNYSLSVLANSDTNKNVTLVVDGNEEINFDLGVGYDEGGSSVTIGDLGTELNSNANITASTSGSIPAAFLFPHYETGVTDNSNDFFAFRFINPTVIENGYTDSGNPFDNRVSAANISSIYAHRRYSQYVNIDGVVYILVPGCGLFKYDGLSVYKPGSLSLGGASFFSTYAPSAAAGGGGSLTGTFSYAQTFVIIDNQNNEIETDLTNASTGVALTTQDMTVTVRNAEPASTKQPIRGAMSTSNMGAASTTVPVDDGAGGDHSLIVGDTIYLYDRATSAYVTTTVTARSASSITVSSAVQLNNNDVISNNVRIRLRRTLDSGTVFYRLVDLPNNPYASTQTYTDAIADADLGAEYIPPTEGFERNNREQDPVVREDGTEVDMSNPTCLAFHDGLLFLGKGQHIRWSLPGSPEYMHQNNNIRLSSGSNEGEIVDMFSMRNGILIFKQRAIYFIQGDFTTADLLVERIDPSVGCVSNGCLREIAPSVLMFVSERGVEILTADFQRDHIPKLMPLFSNYPQLTEASTIAAFPLLLQDPIILSATSAIADPVQGRYRITIFSETASSELAVYKVYEVKFPELEIYEISSNQAVWESGVFYDNRFWWTIYDGSIGSGEDWRVHMEYRSTSPYSYADHTLSIDAYWESGWFTGGDEAIPKKVNDLMLLSLDQLYSVSSPVTVRVYKDWDSSTVVSQGLVTFNNRTQKLTLVPQQFLSMAVKFSVNERFKRLVLSGFKLEVAASHRQAIRSNR